jgi:hypothetical protein
MCRFVEQTIKMAKGSWQEPSYTLLDIQNHISDLRSIWFSRLHSLNQGQAVEAKITFSKPWSPAMNTARCNASASAISGDE